MGSKPSVVPTSNPASFHPLRRFGLRWISPLPLDYRGCPGDCNPLPKIGCTRVPALIQGNPGRNLDSQARPHRGFRITQPELMVTLLLRRGGRSGDRRGPRRSRDRHPARPRRTHRRSMNHRHNKMSSTDCAGRPSGDEGPRRRKIRMPRPWLSPRAEDSCQGSGIRRAVLSPLHTVRAN